MERKNMEIIMKGNSHSTMNKDQLREVCMYRFMDTESHERSSVVKRRKMGTSED
jgi:hypothetical protein